MYTHRQHYLPPHLTCPPINALPLPTTRTGAYSCWASAATGDPEHHCYFAEDGNSQGMPPEALCEIDLQRNLYDRYPRLAGLPIDTDLTDEGVVMTQWPVVPPDQRKPLLPWLREAERRIRGRRNDGGNL